MKYPKEEYPLYPVPELRSLQDILRNGLVTHADRPALSDLLPTPIQQATYAQLYRHVVRFGRALRALGLKERDHVALIGENRVQWGIAYLAITCFNFVVVPIDRNLKENEILTILHASDSRAAVFTESFREMFSAFERSVSKLDTLIDMDLPARREVIHSMKELIDGQPLPSEDNPFPAIDPAAMAVIVFTSGSMGHAKGVMLSQRNICSNLRAMLQMLEIPETDRFLSVLPMHHTYECTCGFLCPLVKGASVHYARSLKTVAEDMTTVRPTVVLGVPLLFEKMYRRISQAIAEKRIASAVMKPLQGVISILEAVGVGGVRRKLFAEVHERFGGHIRMLIVGGAAPDPHVAQGFRALGFTFLQGYGLTECSPILALNRLRKYRDDAAGLPLPGVALRIEDPDNEGRGEIVARGDSIMLGYYKNETATAEVLRDGWFYTGDFGFIDEDGFLHINGRKKNVIIARNGKNVFPEEIEERIAKLPFVLECVVYGSKSDDGNELIATMIVPDANAVYEHARNKGEEVTEVYVRKLLDEQIRKLNEQLPVYKQIRRVTVKDTEFEKTTTQKIKRYLIEAGG
ncbi:MAG: AMP-binding protein [Bacteroidia bacterium]|nr:AMP-binding protein [Bacteroidia bacterium]